MPAPRGLFYAHRKDTQMQTPPKGPTVRTSDVCNVFFRATRATAIAETLACYEAGLLRAQALHGDTTDAMREALHDDREKLRHEYVWASVKAAVLFVRAASLHAQPIGQARALRMYLDAAGVERALLDGLACTPDEAQQWLDQHRKWFDARLAKTSLDAAERDMQALLLNLQRIGDGPLAEKKARHLAREEQEQKSQLEEVRKQAFEDGRADATEATHVA